MFSSGWRRGTIVGLAAAGAALVIGAGVLSVTITRVTVPGMTDSPAVVTAAGAQLLVEQHGCDGSGGQLAWYDPATNAEHWLFKTGAGPSAVAYNSPENGAIL